MGDVVQVRHPDVLHQISGANGYSPVRAHVGGSKIEIDKLRCAVLLLLVVGVVPRLDRLSGVRERHVREGGQSKYY